MGYCYCRLDLLTKTSRLSVETVIIHKVQEENNSVPRRFYL